MVSTKSFEIKKFSGLDKIPTSKVRAFDKSSPATVPSVKYDLIDQMNPEINSKTADPISQTIDVMPDFRFIILYLFYYCTAFYKTLDQRDYPLISPPSLVSYCLVLIHAHFLVCDNFTRDSPSRHADHFMNNEKRRSYLISLLNLPVPKFVEDLLTILSPTTDPRRPQINFIPSYAGYSYDHDFGRLFPVSFFATAHNMLATAQANARPSDTFNNWMFQSLIELGNGASVMRVSNLLGAFHAPNQIYDSWLYNSVYTMLNPIVVRAIAQRSIFNPFNTFPINLGDTRHSTPIDGELNGPPDTPASLNPYIFCLSADRDNIDEMIRFTETMSHLAKTHLDCPKQLGSRYDSDFGLDILIHAYSGPVLPTWCQTKGETIPLPTPGTIPTKRSPTQFAGDTQFLVARPFTPGNAIPFPTTTPDETVLEYYIPTKDARPRDGNPKEDYILFNSDLHVSPLLRILDPYDVNPSTAYRPYIAGLIIESGEIDGFGIPLPNGDISLSHENSFLLQSAIPLSRIVRSTDYENLSLRPRTKQNPDVQPVLTILYNMAQNTWNHMYNNAANQPAAPRAPYGTEQTTTVSWFDQITNIFGGQTGTRARQPGKLADIPNDYIYGWSPYRHVMQPLPAVDNDGIYMLFNLRTLFGTGPPLMEMEHPSVRIPRK
jgi:hypothetical protein